MTERVLVFVEDPGAANAICRLPAALHGAGLEARVVAAEPAAAFLGGRLPLERPWTMDATAMLDRVRPAAALVGTSENPESLGLALVDAARARGVPTVGFVDAFPNAPHRFRGRSANPLAHCPDLLAVPDAWTRDAFVALGVRAESVVVTGHPHDDDVLALRASLEEQGRLAVRARRLPLAPPDRPVVVFAAEISTGLDGDQFQRSDAYTLHGRGGRHGRTEIVLEEVVDAVRAHVPGAHLVLRLHPKNTRDELGALARELDELSAGESALEVVFASDLVIGMTSTILVEAALLGRPTLSVVPRPLERDWLPTVRAGLTPWAATREELARALQQFATGAPPPRPHRTTPGAVDRLVALLRTSIDRVHRR